MWSDQRKPTLFALNAKKHISDSIWLLHCFVLNGRKIVLFFRPPKMKCETQIPPVKIAVDSQMLKLKSSLWQTKEHNELKKFMLLHV